MPSTRTVSRKSRAPLARDDTLAESLPPDLCAIVATDKCGCHAGDTLRHGRQARIFFSLHDR